MRSLCDRKLLTIRNNLTQFKINSFLLGRPLSSRPFSDGADIKSADISPPILDDSLSAESAAKAAATVSNASVTTYESTQESANDVIQRLSFIESVISRYRDPYTLETPSGSLRSSGQSSGWVSGQMAGRSSSRGFHSAEGWDAISTGISYHFGLPEHPNAIKIFIATVPVMMDSFIKFWIFNYLTRYSPASSAIFERMNS